MRKSMECWNCGKSGTYQLCVRDELLQLSRGRTLLMVNSESFKCSECGDEIYSGEQCTKLEEFIKSVYPDYYKKEENEIT